MPERFKHDWAHTGRSRREYDALSDIDREVVDLLVDSLCIDPTVDGITKVDFIMEPSVARLLSRDGWEIVYNVVQPYTVVLYAIERARERR